MARKTDSALPLLIPRRFMSIVGVEQVWASATRIATEKRKTQTAKTRVRVLELAETRSVCVVMARPPELLSRYVSSDPRRRIHRSKPRHKPRRSRHSGDCCSLKTHGLPCQSAAV